jgi:HlyD family secretion protein
MKFGIQLTIAALFLASCAGEDKGIEVQTAKIELRNITEKVEGLGRIRPELDVNITSDVSGRIIELNGLPGEHVKKGQVLVRIDPKNYETALQSSVSSLESAQANLKKASAELKRAKELFAKGFASQAELDIAVASYEVQLANKNQAQSNVDNARDNLSKCTIVAPIDGVITVKNKELGEIAQGSQFTLDVIMVVANLSTMETLVDITENDIVKVKVGQEVDLEIDAFPNQTFRGKVKEIANSATQSATGDQITNFEVKILLLENNPAFRPGMNVTSKIKTNFVSDVVAVPIQAVTARVFELPKLKKSAEDANKEEAAEDDKDFLEKSADMKDSKKLEEVVFVVVDGKVEKRAIVKSISDDNYYMVSSGLSEGEEIVVGPFKVLSTNLEGGEKVSVKNDKGKKNTAKN